MKAVAEASRLLVPPARSCNFAFLSLGKTTTGRCLNSRGIERYSRFGDRDSMMQIGRMFAALNQTSPDSSRDVRLERCQTGYSNLPSAEGPSTCIPNGPLKAKCFNVGFRTTSAKIAFSNLGSLVGLTTRRCCGPLINWSW